MVSKVDLENRYVAMKKELQANSFLFELGTKNSGEIPAYAESVMKADSAEFANTNLDDLISVYNKLAIRITEFYKIGESLDNVVVQDQIDSVYKRLEEVLSDVITPPAGVDGMKALLQSLDHL